MSQKALLELCHEVEQLVGSGAVAALASARLRQKAEVVAALAEKVASLKPLVEMMATLLASTPETAAGRVLPLLVSCRQLRGSLVRNSIPGELELPSPSGPWSTPLSWGNLCQILVALNKDERKILAQFGSSSLFDKPNAPEECPDDLRILDPLLQKLVNTSAKPMRVVCDTLLPRFGRALLPELDRLLRNSQVKSINDLVLHLMFIIDPETAFRQPWPKSNPQT